MLCFGELSKASSFFNSIKKAQVVDGNITANENWRKLKFFKREERKRIVLKNDLFDRPLFQYVQTYYRYLHHKVRIQNKPKRNSHFRVRSVFID